MIQNHKRLILWLVFFMILPYVLDFFLKYNPFDLFNSTNETTTEIKNFVFYLSMLFIFSFTMGWFLLSILVVKFFNDHNKVKTGWTLAFSILLIFISFVWYLFDVNNYIPDGQKSTIFNWLLAEAIGAGTALFALFFYFGNTKDKR